MEKTLKERIEKMKQCAKEVKRIALSIAQSNYKTPVNPLLAEAEDALISASLKLDEYVGN